MRTLLTGVVGSTAYGLAGPGSDVDLLSIGLAPTAEVLGLSGRKAVEQTSATSGPDHVTHELGKFASLALAANPTVLELLWVPQYLETTPQGQSVVAAREAFLSTSRVRAAYAGYAGSQASRIQARVRQGKEGFSSDVRSRTAKHARHCARLLLMGEQLLREGTMTLDVSGHRQWLGDMEQLALHRPDDFAQAFAQRVSRLMEVPSCLGDEPDRAVVESLVVAIRLGDIPG